MNLLSSMPSFLHDFGILCFDAFGCFWGNLVDYLINAYQELLTELQWSWIASPCTYPFIQMNSCLDPFYSCFFCCSTHSDFLHSKLCPVFCRPRYLRVFTELCHQVWSVHLEYLEHSFALEYMAKKYVHHTNREWPLQNVQCFKFKSFPTGSCECILVRTSSWSSTKIWAPWNIEKTVVSTELSLDKRKLLRFALFCFHFIKIVQTACFLSSKSHHKSYQIFILAMCPLWFLWLEVHDQVEIRRFWVHLYVSSYFGCCDATAELVAPVRILYRIFGCECFIKSLNFKESWFGTKSEPNSPTSRVASRIFEVSDVRLDWSQGVFDIQFMCMLYNGGVTYGPIWV